MSELRLLVVVMSALVAPLFFSGCGGGDTDETDAAEETDAGDETDM